MEEQYSHRQWASVILGIIVGVVILDALLLRHMGWPVLIVTGLFVGVGVLFSSLTVSVDSQALRWHFGPGFWRKRVPLAEIAGVEAVRNRWWYGWGIRAIPEGWLYNVSGLDAVEIGLTNGRRIRIGTDEPARLVEAIEAARARHG